MHHSKESASSQADTGQDRRDPQVCLEVAPFFFNKEEFASCNRDGSYGKGSLDATRLNNLKILLLPKFPNSSPLQKDKLWRANKSKINAKCPASKFTTSRDIRELRVQ